jgi:hypothetical protein
MGTQIHPLDPTHKCVRERRTSEKNSMASPVPMVYKME